jgi:hypothetical protein
LFIVLETLDVLFGVSCKDNKLDIDPDQVKESFLAISRKGLSRQTLIYWRQRICQDLENRWIGIAARDMVAFVQIFVARLSTESGQSMASQEVRSDDCRGIDRHAEVLMRKVLQIPESRWKAVLKESAI